MKGYGKSLVNTFKDLNHEEFSVIFNIRFQHKI